MWMLKVDSSSEFLLQQLLIFRNDTSRWFIKHTFRVWSKLQFCIFVIFFFNCTFHLVFVVASKIKLITFYCSLFEWSEHYSNVIMSVMASQIISLTIVYWIVYSGRSKKTSKLSVTGLCEGNSPVTRESPTQRASNAEYVSIWWRRHDSTYWCILNILRTDFIFWSSSVDFPHFGDISTVWIRQICDFRAFSWEHNGEWPQIWHVGVFWPPSEQIRFWSRYVDF